MTAVYLLQYFIHSTKELYVTKIL